LRNLLVNGRILQGGVHRPAAIPPALAREMHLVGNRPGHYQAFLSLVRHWPAWEAARSEYRSIDRPVLLMYGDHDWSRPEEREAELRDVPGSELRIIHDGGHFLALDAPDEFTRGVTEFVAATGDRSARDMSPLARR
jgi:pimeloyl-ACP methyl ester carboxylesterase